MQYCQHYYKHCKKGKGEIFKLALIDESNVSIAVNLIFVSKEQCGIVNNVSIVGNVSIVNNVPVESNYLKKISMDREDEVGER